MDNERPSVSCTHSVNPSGNKPNGVNSHGFYVINAADNCEDTQGVTIQLEYASGHEFTVNGGLLDGVTVKYISASSEQSVSPGPSKGNKRVDWHIKGDGNLIVTATDGSLNTNTTVCVVPPRK